MSLPEDLAPWHAQNDRSMRFDGVGIGTLIELIAAADKHSKELESRCCRAWDRGEQQVGLDLAAAMDQIDQYRADMQRSVARRFGEARGWQLEPPFITFDTLARGGLGEEWDPFDPPEFLEDVDYYRTFDGRAAAIASHLWDFTPDTAEETALIEKCDAYAKDHGLDLEIPEFPSWRGTHWMKLVLWIGPAGRTTPAGNPERNRNK